MRGKPLVPFAVIAIVGLLLMISLSFQGLGASKADEEGEVVEEEVVEFDDPIAAGEEMFQQSCIGCHAGIPLGGIGDKYSHEEIVTIIEKAERPDGPISGMPPGLKKGVEAEAIATYLIEKHQ